MNIQLTSDQSQVVASEGDSVVVIDPQTKQAYRLVREEVFQRVQAILYDDSPWTGGEQAILAGVAFSKLDNDDYSHYLRETPMTFSRGDVLIAFFPTADGSPPKPRPVLLIQADAYNSKIKNLIVAAITSNLKHASDAASLLIDVKTPDGKASGLVQNSVVSCINLATIEDSLVAKKIGQFSTSLMKQVNDCIKVALNLT